MSVSRSSSTVGLFAKSMPAAHVMMPVYNAEKYIIAAIQSVLNQSYANTKLLIYNDDCTDNSMRLVENFIQLHPEYKNKIEIKHGASNKGVGHARGELLSWSEALNTNAYLFWLDSDDKFINKHFIKYAIQQMQETGAEVCLFNFRIIYQHPSQIPNAAGLIKDKENAEKVLQAIIRSPGKSIIPAEFPDLMKFTSLGCAKCYAPTINLPTPADCPFEDFVYMAALLEAKRVTVLPPDLEPVQFLRRSDSITGQRKESNFTHDIPTQLKRFFDSVYASRAKQPDFEKYLLMAQNFVSAKFAQYTMTLEKLIATGYPGLDQATMTAYKLKVEQCSAYISEKIEHVNHRHRPSY
jgi:glycosyltransferase involved in cell wall biosynthesis